MENLKSLYTAILKGQLEESVRLTNEAVSMQIQPQIIIDNYMTKAMEEVGRRFERHEAFVPELLLAGRAMKGALEILKPHLSGESSCHLGKVVIGTVKGDLHDIGKNLVASMLEGCGFEVINVGVDVSSDKFVQVIKEHEADILCLSALLTTTMNYMEEIIEALRTSGIREQVKVMVGGAPVSESFALKIGADGYSENANAAVNLAKSLII